MLGHEEVEMPPRDVAELRLRSSMEPPRERERDRGDESRTIVIRHGSPWQSVAFVVLGVLLATAVLIGYYTLRGIDRQTTDTASVMARFERKIQELEAGMSFDTKRRYMLLGIRDHILRVNPRVGLSDAYRYAQLAIEASERYPAVDPLLLVAIGTVESGYEVRATSRADARGLYQIWPATGRMLLRALGWEYDEAALYDPEKNTLCAALYLDILFSTYSDPQLVLAEYNGGPLNAGYYRARVGALADETKNYVPRVLLLQSQLKDRFERGLDLKLDLMHRDAQREAKTLTSAAASGKRSAP